MYDDINLLRFERKNVHPSERSYFVENDIRNLQNKSLFN